MPRSFYHIAALALFATIVSSPCSAAIVNVKYEGVVNVVGSNISGFAIGDAVWGEYFYDSLSPVIAASIFGSEHAAIRYLSVHASSGFAGAVNSGVINSPIQVPPPSASLYDETMRPDYYRVSNWPALIRGVSYFPDSDVDGDGILDGVGRADDIDSDGQYGPDGYDFETPGRGPDTDIDLPFDFEDYDIESLRDAADQSAKLGLPAPSGAFVQGHPIAIHLMMYGNALPASTSIDPLAPPPLDLIQSATGSIYFGYFTNDDPRQKVEFTLTKIAAVPEPASLIVAFVGIIAAASRQRLRRVV
jgi:hypothetical protein